MTANVPIESTPACTDQANGSAMASILGAGIGAFAMGAFVLLNETGLFAAPTLYAPAGGISGRTTLAVVAWLIAWGVLHRQWKGREIGSRRICLLAVILALGGVVGTFPPTWALL